MIVAHLLSDTNLCFVVARLTRSDEKFLWKELAGFVEIVSSSLSIFSSIVYGNGG